MGHVHTNMRIFLHESAFLPHEISDPKPQFFEAAFQNNLRPNQDNKYIYIYAVSKMSGLVETNLGDFEPKQK